MQSIINTPDTAGVPLKFDLTTKRVRKGVVGISGTVQVTDDMSKYTAEVEIYHSPQRNNIFKLLPFKVPLGPVCEKVNGEYRQYLIKDLHPVSDLPFSENDKEDLCPQFANGVRHKIGL